MVKVAGRRGLTRQIIWAMAMVSIAGVVRAETDPFQCYKARTTTPFAQRTVALESKYGDGSFEVVAPRSLCNPAIVDEKALQDGTAHLECYKAVPNSFTPFGPTRRTYANAFGTQSLEIGEPRRLCVPTKKNGEASTLAIDHFTCFATVEPQKLERSTAVVDQFQSVNETATKPKLVCTATSKNDEPVSEPTNRLVCFKAKPETEFTPRLATTENQFGAETLNVIKPNLLCLPSREIENHGTGGGSCESSDDCPQGQICNDSGTCQPQGCGEGCGFCQTCEGGECVTDPQCEAR